MLQHPYEGLVHDSVLYGFSALAHLHPQSLGNDLFLRFGSQDRFTVFSPIAAAVIQVLGLENAAALITAVAQLAFLISAWFLARRLMPSALALLGVGLLIALPATYGAGHLFSYEEGFMTPRVPAEALVLAGLAALLASRYAVSGLFGLAALLVHPLMAAAGLVLALILHVGMPRPRLAIAVAAGSFLVLVAIAYLAPIGPFARFDSTWYEMLHTRLPYLYPSNWIAQDWGHTCVPLTVLAVGALTLRAGLVRSLCLAALLTGLAGLILALIGSDLLRIEIVTQVQPWRWTWLANALAVLLSPAIVINCWNEGAASRAAVILLVAAWVCADERFAPLVAILAIAVACARGRSLATERGKLLLLAAWLVLAIGMLLFVATVLGVLRNLARIEPDHVLYSSPYLLLLRQLRPWASGGVLPTGLLVLMWAAAVTASAGSRSFVRGGSVLLVGLVLCTAVAPLAVSAWTVTALPQSLQDRFAAWRAAIAPNTEVLWVQTPLGPWYLLGRPSYWTLEQMAGLAFSRATAMELTRRESILTHQPRTGDPVEELTNACRSMPEVGFIVTPRYLGPTPFDPIAPTGEHSNRDLRMYPCTGHRG